MTEEEATTLGTEALAQLKTGDIVGLGTGQAATGFIRALGAAVKSGLSVTGVTTSEVSTRLASSLGIPLLPEPTMVDVAVDGADEVAPNLDLIKGYGGALVREKIVASAARRFIVVVDKQKLVPTLGTRGRLPVEVLPFARAYCHRRLTELGLAPVLRSRGDVPFTTDNGNLILDLGAAAIADPAALELKLRAIPGVVGTGLFWGMADTVLVWDNGVVRALTRKSLAGG